MCAFKPRCRTAFCTFDGGLALNGCSLRFEEVLGGAPEGTNYVGVDVWETDPVFEEEETMPGCETSAERGYGV